VALGGAGVMHGPGGMAVTPRHRPLLAAPGFRQVLRDGPLNCRHRQSNTRNRPIADQAGHQCQ
jgi:hypothetical protein